MANRKPPLYKPYGGTNPNANWNTTQGPAGGRKEIPYKFNTATGQMMPQSFEEAGMPPEAYGIQGPTPFERNMPRFDTANFDSRLFSQVTCRLIFPEILLLTIFLS